MSRCDGWKILQEVLFDKGEDLLCGQRRVFLVLGPDFSQRVLQRWKRLDLLHKKAAQDDQKHVRSPL